MNIKIIREPVSLENVREIAREVYHDMVKGVVDVEREIIALGGEWHMDANTALLADGSEQQHVWGFNLHVDERGVDALRFVSLINIRPALGKKSMEIEDSKLRAKIHRIVKRLVPELFV